jgi:hypothetical protein
MATIEHGKRVSVYIPHALAKQLDDNAHDARISRSQYVSIMLADRFKKLAIAADLKAKKVQR